MFYDLTNNPGSCLRRQKRMFKLKATGGDTHKYLGKPLGPSRDPTPATHLWDKKIPPRNDKPTYLDLNQRKYSRDRSLYTNNQNVLHSLIR
jgi:hypothetical protein